MKIKHITKLFPACLALLAGSVAAQAQSGVWTNDASSVWGATTNWLNGTVANGTDATADFSTANISVDRTATLDAPHSLGSLIFGNTAAPHNWFLNSGGGALTLATSSGSPTIAVTNIAVITAPLAGTSGFTKSGNGTLVLGGTNGYTGNTTISAGTLQLTNTSPSSGAAFTNAPVLYFSFDNVIGNTVVNQGTGGAVMNGSIIGASVVPGGRYGNALSIPAGVAANAYVLVNNAVVPLNGQAGNNWTVAMWLKTSTAGGVYMYQGSGAWASGNTEFYLENGTQGDGAGTHAGGVRNSQAWVSGTAAINDGNWHFVVMTLTNATKTIYVDGAIDAILSGATSWTGSGVGTQVRIGGAAAGADSQIGLNGLIDEVYVYNRALSLADIQTLTNTASGPTWNLPLPTTTSVAVTSPAILDLNGNSPNVAALTGNGTVNTTLAAGTPTLSINNSSADNFTGVISNTVGTLSLMKSGAGNLTLAGTNAYTGATYVNGGTLTLSSLNNIYNTTMIINGGTVVLSGTNNSTGTHTLNNNGVLSVSGGVINSVNGTVTKLLVGNSTGANAAVYQTGANSLVWINSGGGDFQMGSVPGASGYYNFASGSLTIGNGGEIDPGGSTGGAGTFGEYDQSGGTLTVGLSGTGATYFLPNRGAAGESSVVNFNGGTVSLNPTMTESATFGGFEINWGAGSQTNATTISGNAVFTSPSESVKLNQANNAANFCSMNLNGGLFQTLGFTAGHCASAVVSFNGGTLEAGSAANANFMGNVASVYVYGNGGTINDNGQTVTIAQQFLAPTGSGVSSIPVTAGGAGYTMPPMVIIQDASGSGATAYATVSGGAVTGIIVTCPGVNYTAPTVSLVGGGYSSPATAGSVAIAANTSGGLTKTGSGNLVLAGGFNYAGATVIQGGTLSLTPATITPATPNALVITNAALAVDASSGTPLPLGSLTWKNNATNNISYGSVSANPVNPAINVSGPVSIPGTGVIINITGFGLKVGQFTLVKYTGTPLASLAGVSLGNLPPGVAGSLVNNTGNDSIDLLITGTGQNLSWYGLLPDGVNVSSNWDITLTTNWVGVGTTSPALRYQEYTSGGSTVGDPVTFDDTLYNNGSTPPATNINLTTTVRPFAVVFNSSMPYSLVGPGGITGLGGIQVSNTGSLTIGTSNSFTGGLSINGASVIVTNDTAFGASSSLVTLNGATLQVNGNNTNNARSFSVPANSTIDIPTNVTARFGGPVTGAGGLTKTDNGTLTLAGSNAITGTLTVNQGTLTTLGTNILAAVPVIGNAFGFNGVLNIAGGLFQDNNNPANVYNSSLTIGNASGAAGDLVMSAGTLTIPKQLTIGPGTYGAFSQSGGTTTIGGFIALGGSTSDGVLNQSGGTIGMNGSSVTIGYGITTSVAVMNLSGSAVFNLIGAGNGIWPGEVGTGTLNVSGSAALTITNSGLSLGLNNAAGNGTVNLLGGTATVNFVTRGAGSGTLNFNGGTLKANYATNSFIHGLNSANVYNGGATIDDGGLAITIPQPLLAATGYGVATIPVTAGGAGYIDSPVVTISGGNGSNAMATATVSGGVVTALNVTCPGSGYLNGDSLSVSFTGGGANPTQPTVGTITFAANGTGGLTKKGAGLVTLTGSNIINGPITVNGGTLSLNSASTYGGSATVNAGTLNLTTASQLTGNVTVTNGASFGLSQVGTGTGTIGNLTLGLSAATNGATLNLAFAGGNSSSALLNCGTLTLSGTNAVSLAGRFTIGLVPLVKYTGSLAGSGIFSTNLILPQGVVGVLSNSAANSTLYAVITSTGPGLVWTGTNSGLGLTNLWDINSTTNWQISGTPTTYQQTVSPGDSVTFNDLGTGVVIVNTNVAPFSLVISNNLKSYAFNGGGGISGSSSLQKLGTNSLTLSLTNNSYTGGTVVSNGLVVMGAANAIGSGTLGLNNSTAELEMSGFSESFGGLSGLGIIDNNGATDATLTTGNGGGVWSGTITNLGAGGVCWINNNASTLVVNGTNYLNAAAASEVQNGTVIITNGGVMNLANSEFWIAANAAVGGTVIVDGGSLIDANNWLVVGRANASAHGTLIVNHGTVQKAGANNIVVGSLGATGTVIVNGGQILNNADLWLGEGPTAVATLYLNGGLVQATAVRANNNGGLPTVSPVAYFNGGTLEAMRSTNDFIEVTSMVMSNGLVLDDGGFTIGIQGPLQSGDGFGGGLVKKGAGTVYIDGFNSYSGTTLVTNGTLAGSGYFSGPVVVAPTGNLGAGDASGVGSMSLEGTPLTLQGNVTLRVDKTGGAPASDQINFFSTVAFGGTLTITNITSDGTLLTTNDTFQLFSAGGTGNFTSIAGSPGSGLAYSFNPASGLLGIVASSIASNPTNITASVSGGTLTLTWPADHLGWILQSQTNTLSTGLSTNWFDVSGSSSSNTNIISINPAAPTVFYRLRHP